MEQLSALLSSCIVSRIIETEPVGVTDVQPPYLNAVAVGYTSLDARALLTTLLDLERRQGRERSHHWAPRTLDLDLVLFGASIISEPQLTVPHPRFRERRFVLEPLAEVAPDALDPVTGQTASELLAELDEREQ